MNRRFETVVIVDWSSRADPSPARPSPDALWIGAAGEGGHDPRYFRTRTEAIAWLGAFLAEERGRGRRVLVGFDFPFGYPRGFAAALTGRAEALALWEHLAARVSDGPDNSNNRFETAAALNARLPGIGPFWGRPARHAFADLPERGSLRCGHGFPERRLVEDRVRGAQPVWKLYTTGSVGGQVLTGIPAVLRLSRDPRLAGAVAIWPLQTGLVVPEAPIVFAEVYPSLLAAQVRAARRENEVLDAAQVRVTAAAFAALDGTGGLAALFSPEVAPGDRETVAAEEAWILGVGHEAPLLMAASPAPLLANDCFALPPGVTWVPVDVALARLRDGLAPTAGTERIAIAQAGGRILAAPLIARRAHPPAPNAAVDGYGFAHAALGPGPNTLPLWPGRAAAGAPFADAVPLGKALRILTGAILPDGVDTIVLQEDVTLDGATLHFARGLRRGANTRPAGEDVQEGAVLFPTGHQLLPQDLALAAATGAGDAEVRRPLRVAVLSTGDEIAPQGSPVAAHQIHDANRPMLLDMLRRWGMIPRDLGYARDTAEAVAAALDRGAAEADAILTSGGASAGDEDHVAALLALRGTLVTWRIAVKPGRPLALGVWNGTPVFGLPGNPVAAFVCALIFARPALGLLAGGRWEEPHAVTLPAAFAKSKRSGRMEYLRARLDREGRVEIFASEGSGRISGLAWARGLVELEECAREVRPGDPVRYLPFAEFGL